MSRIEGYGGVLIVSRDKGWFCFFSLGEEGSIIEDGSFEGVGEDVWGLGMRVGFFGDSW